MHIVHAIKTSTSHKHTERYRCMMISVQPDDCIGLVMFNYIASTWRWQWRCNSPRYHVLLRYQHNFMRKVHHFFMAQPMHLRNERAKNLNWTILLLKHTLYGSHFIMSTNCEQLNMHDRNHELNKMDYFSFERVIKSIEKNQRHQA